MEVIKDPKIHAALELLNAYAKEKTDAVGDLISKNYKDLRDTVVKSSKTVMKDYPWAVVGVGALALLGTGLLIGALVARNRK
jgi:ElaB/YqjD/DUF883 family membrane-anchored ribosome-binding protein